MRLRDGFVGWGVLLTALLAAAQPHALAPVQFSDTAKAAGIKFIHYKGNAGAPMILAEQTPGVCVADFDGDGWPDIYFVNGGDVYSRNSGVANALYHNNGDGTFTDVSAKAGVPGTGYGLGCIWGDYDNDGRPDLFVTQYGRNVLYHNNGDGTFTDVTDKAGLGSPKTDAIVHSGAVFVDYDRDGFLDLYVGGYVLFGPDSPQTCIVYGVRTSCAPSAYEGVPNRLFHNNRDGTFTDVTERSGILQPHGKNLAIGAADYDNDGWPDIFVANDGVFAYLFHNEHDGTFKERALITGMAVTGDGQIMAGMCISLGDYNNDGWLDLYVSDWQGRSDHLWRNDGKGAFEDVTEPAGMNVATRDHLSFGGGFFDFDNDGHLDLFIANGHVFPVVEEALPGVKYKQTNTLLHNERDGTFKDVSKHSGTIFAARHLGRGVAFFDYDNDGNVDLVVGNDGEAPLLLHNGGGAGNHFVSLKLVGTKSNRDAIGARVHIVASGLEQLWEVQSGGSYLSHSDLRVHFGLGKSAQIDTLEVSWPSGATQAFHDVPGNKFYVLEEGNNALGLQHFVRTSRQVTSRH